MGKTSIEWTEETCAYLAGLVDGEGSLHPTVGSLRPSEFPGCGRRLSYPALTVAMTYRPVIDWLGELLGVRVQFHNPTEMRRHPARRKQWRVTTTGSRAVEVCRRLLPYLRVKREQALLVLAWPEDARRGPGRRLDQEDWFAREAFADELRSLNG